jgi:hypothetical protein
VTGILQGAGYIDATWYTESAATRGTHIHKLTAAIDLDQLTLSDVSSSPYRAFVMQYIAAKRLLGLSYTDVEVRRVHGALDYSGQADRIGVRSGRPFVLDIKTGETVSPAKWHGYQLAAYEMLWSTMPWGVMRRYVLHLTPTTFQLKPYSDRNDHAVFLEALHDQRPRHRSHPTRDNGSPSAAGPSLSAYHHQSGGQGQRDRAASRRAKRHSSHRRRVRTHKEKAQ